ncbi:recombination mediator RecR [Chlamydiia bacterium]|nr:recombination mediator RecR [Chlamydiia bacterium]
MNELKLPPELENIIDFFTKLSGVGAKTASRYALEVIQWTEQEQKLFSESLNTLTEEIGLCDVCGSMRNKSECTNCNKDQDIICVLAMFKHAMQLAQSKCFAGTYHILGGHISPIKGVGVEDLRIEALKKRLTENTKEIVLAFDATLEGDATAFYLKEMLEDYANSKSIPLQITRLSFGLPMGNSMEYIDGVTMGYAFNTRKRFT